ncbi:DUF1153 domain-containing protein [Sphingomonas solaris]|uniref:DUF1153 domain-containing protein n=1 Tax=Alterirhizorhabdus solaris TaxID=2529389 RepID=A0A558QTW5_9SPHN|nr:DUF1153 domain-containing protein [Sphingomonas solaris]TVV70568.1 DUF1153 domain-containing protein [Sphingomonas solaris]
MTDPMKHYPVEVATQHCGELTEADLPPRYNRRWSPLMKARVVAAIECGLLSANEAGVRYSLSQEELLSWQRGLAHSGLEGLTQEGQARVYKSVYQSEARI